MHKAADKLKNFDSNVEKLGKGFDAQLAITVAAALDGMLEEALARKMKPLNREMKRRLFEGYGPLSNFSAKIDIAYALKLITKQTYDTFRTVQKIRNIFAHRNQLTDFETPEIVTLLNTLDLNTSFTSMKARYMVLLTNLQTKIGR